MLSYRLKIPLLASPCEGCLVVDDDFAIGSSMTPYIMRGYDTAVMFGHKTSPVRATYIYKWFDDYEDEFLVFPWGE